MPILALPTLLVVLMDGLLGLFGAATGYISYSLITAIGFLVVTILIYAAVLRPTGNVLFNREQRILDALVKDKE